MTIEDGRQASIKRPIYPVDRGDFLRKEIDYRRIAQNRLNDSPSSKQDKENLDRQIEVLVSLDTRGVDRLIRAHRERDEVNFPRKEE